MSNSAQDGLEGNAATNLDRLSGSRCSDPTSGRMADTVSGFLSLGMTLCEFPRCWAGFPKMPIAGDPAVELRMRQKELAESRVRYGYRRLHVLLQRERHFSGGTPDR